MRSLVFCDTETTGLDAEKHRVVEICVCRVQEGDWNKVGLLKAKFRLTDQTFAEASPEALKVNGYMHGGKKWRSAPVVDSAEAMRDWEKVLRMLSNAVFVNQNAPFDLGFIQSELARHGLPAYEPQEVWEVRDFSSQILEAAKQEGWSLHPAYTTCGGIPAREHRADADVLRAIWVVASGMEQFPKTWENRPEVSDTAKMKKYVTRKLIGFALGDVVGRKKAQGQVPLGVALSVERINKHYRDLAVKILDAAGKVQRVPLCTSPKCSRWELCGRPDHLVTFRGVSK